MGGRDRGLSFNLEVSIELAGRTRDLARAADERGDSLNDLRIGTEWRRRRWRRIEAALGEGGPGGAAR